MEKSIGSIKNIFLSTDTLVALGVIGILVLFIIPMSPTVLSLLLVFNLTISLIILLLTMFTTDILQFSVFPTLLLITTLFRLGLNISSTRLILTEGNAGEVIDAFGNFVVRGDYVVGVIIFIIIFIIQFVVITNGSGRVAEVAARFTLDAMPGKQMSIDADLNAGIINEKEAQERRRNLQQEADFYGSMDGASKFVKGDAIAGIIITIVNILGGIIVGMLNMNLTAMEALEKFCLLTIGDGLVSQIPALLISTAAGILVTRNLNNNSFGKEVSSQLTAFPKVIGIASVILLGLGLVPSLPNIPFLILAACTGFFAYTLYKEEKKIKISQKAEAEMAEILPIQKEPENIMNLFQVDTLEIEIGYGLIPLTDTSSGGDLLDRIAAVRRQCATELGVVVQPIRIRDNLQLSTNEYKFKIKGIEVAGGEALHNYLLAMDPAGASIDIEGIKTNEPTFGLPAVWITKDKKDRAEMKGLTVVDPVTVLITHLTEVIKHHSHELLGRQEVKLLIDTVRESYNAVVDELIPDLMSIGEVQKVLQNLLKERVPIRDIITILESLADNARSTKDTEVLTEYVRFSLGRVICRPFVDETNSINVITMHPKLEQLINDNIHKSFQGSFPSLNPADTENIFKSIKNIVDSNMFYNNTPILLCSPRIRPALRRMTEMVFPEIPVLSMNEIPGSIGINSVGVVSLDDN
ncbi:flagellar biosynthesis protein FlhA [Oxobacter pfennigii]|uniref:Flagellar biosynthesis protein FlhA n=1 Tax=Oxobacter pfennigii TaxID=36849 RepID=A0A0N8NTF7_9CLOT|nr:flagellar biosynthesis protein FlhA [Oxobacter pfennigii]